MEPNEEERLYPDDYDIETDAYRSTASSSFPTKEYELKRIESNLKESLNASDAFNSIVTRPKCLIQYYCHKLSNANVYSKIDSSLELGNDLRMMAQNFDFESKSFSLPDLSSMNLSRRRIPKYFPRDLPSTSGGINDKNQKLFFPSHRISSKIHPIIDVDKKLKHLPNIDKKPGAFFPWNKSKHAKQLQPIPVIEYTMEKYTEDMEKQFQLLTMDDQEIYNQQERMNRREYDSD